MKPPHWETNSNNSLLSSPVWWPTTFIVTTIATISTTSITWNEGGGGGKKEEVFIWYKMKHVTYTSDFLKQGLQVFHVQLPGTTTNFHIRVYTQQKSHLLSEDSIFVNILCKKSQQKTRQFAMHKILNFAWFLYNSVQNNNKYHASRQHVVFFQITGDKKSQIPTLRFSNTESKK